MCHFHFFISEFRWMEWFFNVMDILFFFNWIFISEKADFMHLRRLIGWIQHQADVVFVSSRLTCYIDLKGYTHYVQFYVSLYASIMFFICIYFPFSALQIPYILNFLTNLMATSDYVVSKWLNHPRLPQSLCDECKLGSRETNRC